MQPRDSAWFAMCLDAFVVLVVAAETPRVLLRFLFYQYYMLECRFLIYFGSLAISTF